MSLEKLDDRALLALWREHALEAAFTALYRRHNRRLVGWAVQATRERALAEDVAQETWRWLLTWRGTLRAQDLLSLLAGHARFVVLRERSARAQAAAAVPQLARNGLQSADDYRPPPPPTVHMRNESGRAACGQLVDREQITTDPELCTCRERACRCAVDDARAVRAAWRAELARRGMLPPSMSDPQRMLEP